MTLLEHTLTTSAAPASVWAVLEDAPRWGDWNTLLLVAPQGLALGAPLSLTIRLGRLQIPARAEVVAFESERSLVWAGGVSGLFHARHGFDLIPSADGGTTIRHHEAFGGLLHRPLLRALGDRQREVYGRVNKALAAAALARGAP